MILYHRTDKKNLSSIRCKGLIAQCGSACVGENAMRVGVYLWRNRENDGFRGKIVLTVEIPATHLSLLRRDEEFFEDELEAWVYPFDIPPEWIDVAK